MIETYSVTDLKNVVSELIEDSGKITDNFKKKISAHTDFFVLFEKLSSYFTKSKAREVLKERLKVIAEQEEDLVKLLEMRELCMSEDLLNLRQSIENFWEKRWTHLSRTEPETCITFLRQKIEGICFLPHFAQAHIKKS